MKIKVLKFGGTSVGSVEAIKRSANIICDWSKKSKVIVVLSACLLYTSDAADED